MNGESSRDPWAFQRWARALKLGNPTRKLILQSLAITAESNTGYGFAMQADLAEHAECSVRTVGTHLNALEEAGLIARRRRFSKGGRRIADGFLLLADGVTEWPDGTPARPADSSGEESASGSPAQSPPEAQVAEQEQPSGTTQEQESEERADPRNSLPGGFPEDLTQHAREVFAILRRVAADHQAKKVWPKALGVAMLAHPSRRYVAVARELELWAVDPDRDIKDVVRTYSTFLKRSPQIEGIERLEGDAPPGPTSAPRARRGGGSQADQVQANLDRIDRELAEALAREAQEAEAEALAAAQDSWPDGMEAEVGSGEMVEAEVVE